MADRTMTAAAVTASQVAHGVGQCHLGEFIFGAAIRADPAAPTEPDTRISWVSEGDVGYHGSILCEVSLDDGFSWHVATNGGRIPTLEIGDVVTDKTLLIRELWLLRARLVSVTVTMTLDDNTVIARTESGAALALGTLSGVRYESDTQRVRLTNESSLNFNGKNGAVIIDKWLDYAHAEEDDFNNNGGAHLHISHGNPTTTTAPGQDPLPREEQDPDAQGPNYLQQAACAAEMWIRPRSLTGRQCLMGWNTYGPQPINKGGHSRYEEPMDTDSPFVLFYLENDQLGFQIIERTPGPSWEYHALRVPSGILGIARWHHVAWAYDGYWIELVIDGQLVARDAWPRTITTIARPPVPHKITDPKFGPIFSTTGMLVLGRHPTRAEGSYNGEMSELRVYNRKLTIGAITQRLHRRLYTAELASMRTNEGLVAYYPMTDGAGTELDEVFDNPLNGGRFEVSNPTGTTPVGDAITWTPTSTWTGIQNPLVSTPSYVSYRISPPLSLLNYANPVRLTNAPMDITWNGKVFTGVGKLGSIEAIEETARLQATGLKVSVSGLDPSHISAAFNTHYVDNPARLWLAMFNQNGTLVDAPVLIFSGRMDEIQLSSGGGTATVAMALESHLLDWERPPPRRWTEADQRERFPRDAGLELLDDTAIREVWWPARVAPEQRDTA